MIYFRYVPTCQLAAAAPAATAAAASTRPPSPSTTGGEDVVDDDDDNDDDDLILNNDPTRLYHAYSPRALLSNSSILAVVSLLYASSSAKAPAMSFGQGRYTGLETKQKSHTHCIHVRARSLPNDFQVRGTHTHDSKPRVNLNVVESIFVISPVPPPPPQTPGAPLYFLYHI